MNDTPAAKSLSVAERLAAAQEKKAARLLAEEERAKGQALALLELENRLEEEGKGPRGVNFELVDGEAEGPIAVRLGEMVLYKRFTASMKGGADPVHEDLFAYVNPCVLYPDKAAFAAIIDRRPVLLMRCANALTTLFGAKSEGVRGKF